MLNYRDAGLLLQIIDHCKRIASIIEPTSKQIFDNDTDAKELTTLHIMLIGELVKKLSDSFLLENDKVDWKKIMGMRDKMIHHYDKVNYDIVWSAAFNDCPKLSKYCREIIENSEFKEEL